MGNSTEIPLQGEILLFNQLELVTATTVAGTLYGIAFSLFCLYVHSLVAQFSNGDRKRQAKFMLGYTTVIMLCGMYNLVSNAFVTQDAYVKHSNYPGGPFFYTESTYHTNPQIIVGLAFQLTVDIMTLAIQVRSYFSPIYPTTWLNSGQDLAGMGYLERHSICQFGHCAVHTVFLVILG
jgi:hypothetical protein